MNMWTEIRRLVLTGQRSKRAICREYEIHWETLEKILNHSEPPGVSDEAAAQETEVGTVPERH
jgi:hypothetical protein